VRRLGVRWAVFVAVAMVAAAGAVWVHGFKANKRVPEYSAAMKQSGLTLKDPITGKEIPKDATLTVSHRWRYDDEVAVALGVLAAAAFVAAVSAPVRRQT
jgi:hypothetical protein